MIPEQVSINTAQCIKEASHFGYTVYVNICNGQTTSVAWGGVDWLLGAMLTALGLAIVGVFVAIAVMIIGD